MRTRILTASLIFATLGVGGSACDESTGGTGGAGGGSGGSGGSAGTGGMAGIDAMAIDARAPDARSPDADTGMMPDADPPPSPDAAPTVNFATQVQPIFNSRCASSSCHGVARQAGLDLRAGQSYSYLVGVASTQCIAPPRLRVMPGNSGQSYIVNKIQGVDLCAGVRMPASGPPLSAAQEATIVTWIDEGALP